MGAQQSLLSAIVGAEMQRRRQQAAAGANAAGPPGQCISSTSHLLRLL